MLIVGKPGIHLNMSYHGGQNTVERDYMELGLCAVCHNEIKVSRNIFGKVIQAKACLICQKNINNETTNCSIWTICGGAGTGKTTLFNLLAGTERKTSSALLSETSCEETINDVLRPQYCCIQGYESIFLVDSEGINGLRIDHSEEVTVDVHVAILKQTCVRMEAGSSGIVLTLACGERCDKASFDFIALLSKTLGKFPLIVVLLNVIDSKILEIKMKCYPLLLDGGLKYLQNFKRSYDHMFQQLIMLVLQCLMKMVIKNLCILKSFYHVCLKEVVYKLRLFERILMIKIFHL